MTPLIRILPTLAFVAATFSAAGLNAQQDATGAVPPVNILDGQRFAGEIGPHGKTSGKPDEFIFTDGTFYSRACLEVGFTPGPYWVRVADGRLHFLARLTSEENGVMTYRGTVSGSKMDARMEWVKPRWYWTMKRKFWFRGVSGTDAKVGRK